ncbi:DNA-binding protein [uncultured archaeon]|nr:DNA-binding protein [uncultured archaeon]
MARQQAQASTQEQVEQQIRAEEYEKQLRMILAQILTPEARSRLGNVRVARPDYARQVELILVQLHQARRLPTPVTDADLKQILSKISEATHRDWNIKK